MPRTRRRRSTSAPTDLTTLPPPFHAGGGGAILRRLTGGRFERRRRDRTGRRDVRWSHAPNGWVGVSAETATIIGWVLVLADLAIRIAALIIIPRDRKPTAAMAWLLAIFLIPFVGIILFLLIGSPKLPKARRERQNEINRMIADRGDRLDLPDGRAEWPAWFASVVEQNRKLGALPAVGGNAARLIGDYRGSIDAMAADIDTATRFVHVEFFIVALDDTTKGFFAAMERAVQRGVVVRLLLDYVASKRVSLHAATIAELDRIGVKWSYMLAVQPTKGKYQRPDLRNHRKLVVVDGLVGVHRVAEPHRPQLRLGEEPEARPAVAGAGDPGHRTDGDRDQRGVPVGLVQRDRRAARRRGERAGRRGARRPLARCAGLPGRAERSGVRGREQPPAVPLARVVGPEAGHHHEPVLRSRRGHDVRHHVGEVPRPRRAAVRLRDRRPGLGVACPAFVLQSPC